MRIPTALASLIFAMLTAVPALGCQPMDAAAGDSLQPAQGWILVRNGSVADIKAAVADYDGLLREVRPGCFRVELHRQGDGAVAVLFPDGLPAYDLANMTGWLSAPPGRDQVDGAVAWITSPGDGTRYYLEPETGNPWGDTLVGASSRGRSVRVSLPETGLSEVSVTHAYQPEPRLQLSPTPVALTITLDTSAAFGNPAFVIDSPRDHDWRL